MDTRVAERGTFDLPHDGGKALDPWIARSLARPLLGYCSRTLQVAFHFSVEYTRISTWTCSLWSICGHIYHTTTEESCILLLHCAAQSVFNTKRTSVRQSARPSQYVRPSARVRTRFTFHVNYDRTCSLFREVNLNLGRYGCEIPKTFSNL